MTADTRGTVVPAHWVLATRLGELTVVHEGGVLTGLYFPRHWPRPDRAGFGVRADRGSEKVARQLHEYLAGDRSVFDLPIEARGAEFDRRVWDLIMQVPYPAAAGQALPVAALAPGANRGRACADHESRHRAAPGGQRELLVRIVPACVIGCRIRPA